VKLNSIILDFNHPLAGEDLYFEGKVVGVEWDFCEPLSNLFLG
jgi:FKBP-type peptidyl-prolyl cis-trans isomerase 2